MRLLALCCVGRTDLMLDVAPLRLRSNRLAALPKTKIRTARARIRWRILVPLQSPEELSCSPVAQSREHLVETARQRRPKIGDLDAKRRSG